MYIIQIIFVYIPLLPILFLTTIICKLPNYSHVKTSMHLCPTNVH